MRAGRKPILIFAFSCLCLLAGKIPAAAQNWANGCAYRRAITIDHTRVPNTDQVNFPVLISGTYSYLATTANGGNVTNANGYDILFASDANGVNPLPFEQESYNPSTGAVTYWVKLPSVSHTSDTVFYMFYGNSSISTDQSNKAAVWDSNYKGVWHLPNGSNLSGADSTSNGYNLTNNNSTAATAGKVDGAASFNGSNNYLSNSALSINAGSSITISFWNYVTSADLQNACAFTIGASDNPNRIVASVPWSDQVLYWDYGSWSGGGRVSQSYASYLGQWTYIVLQYNSSNNAHSIYLNSNLGASNANSNAPQATQTGINIGAWPSYYHRGSMDEFRVSTIARSTDWIAAEYNNQNSPSTFYGIGAAAQGTMSHSITQVSPNPANFGDSVFIQGTNFGTTQGTSTVSLNGTSLVTQSWTNTAIAVSVPFGASTGYFTVTVGGQTAVSPLFAVRPIPSGWSDGDIGSVGSAGSASYANGTFTVLASGQWIYGTADGMHFVYQSLSSDGTIVARVVSAQGSAYPQAGVMIRETLGASSAHAYVAYEPYPGPSIYFYSRASTGGSTASQSTPVSALPYWVKLVRSGSTFSGYVSSDGANWAQLGTSQTISMAQNVYIGLAVSANNNSAVATAAFDNVGIGQPPNITSISPTQGAVATSVTILGQNFGATQGSGSVTFNGTVATQANWNSSSIVVPVPTGATTGNVVVNASGLASNGVPFTVLPAPSITGVSPTSGVVGTSVTITGNNFGATQGAGTVKFNGTPTTPTSWSATSIVANVPSGAATGNIVVNASGVPSNGVSFTVINTGTLSGSVTKAADGTAISGATIQALQAGVVKASASSAADGTYSISNITAGTYDIKFSATGYGTSFSLGISVAAGSTTSLNATLAIPGSVGGQVTQSNGTTAISGATVTVYQGSQSVGTATTAADGSYTVSGLGPATYRVEASATGYVTKSQTGVAVTSGNMTTTNFSLNALGTGAINYVYDELGRLIGVIDLSGDAGAYTYDAVGNLLSISRGSASQISLIAFQPRSASVGATVTIYGTGFSTTASLNSVSFNGTQATITSSTATQIVVTVPLGATTGPISVTSPAGSVASSSPFTVLASGGNPAISGFTPSIGTPGTAVSISGSNFDGTPANNKAKFNLTPPVVTASTSSSLTTSVPAGATSGRISLTTPGGSTTSVTDFFVPPAPHVTSDVVFTGRVSIDSNIAVSIGTANKIGLVVFDGTAGQRVSYKMTNITFGQCTISVFNPDGSTLVSPTNCINNGVSFIAPVALPKTGTYTVMVEGGTYTGGLTLNLYNVVDQQYSWSVGGGGVVNITTPGQSAYVSFSGTAGQQVSWLFSAVTIANSNAWITNPDGSTLIASSAFGTSGKFIDTTTLPQTGLYTVGIAPWNGNTGTMTLNIYNPADVTGTITIGGAAVTVSLTIPGQNVRLTFTGNSGQKVSVLMTSVTYPASIVSIVKPDGSTLGSQGTYPSSAFLDTQTLPTTGTYTLLVAHQGTNTGNLTLTLYNANDVTGTITTDGTVLSKTTTSPGQDVALTFSGTAGQRVSMYVATNYAYVNVAIVNPDGSTLTSAVMGTSTGVTSRFFSPMTLPTTGTYIIRSNHLGYTYTGTLNFQLWNVPSDISGTITPGGPAVTVTIAAPGQQANLTFSGTANQRVSLTATNSTIASATVYLKKPDGTTLTWMSFGTSGGFIDAITLPTTGTYTLNLQPDTIYTGAVTLTLYDATEVTGTITPGGSSVTLTTTVPGQNGKLTFSGTSGQKISFSIYPTNISNSNVFIYKPDGSTLAAQYNVGSGGTYIDRTTLPSTGTYTIYWDPAGQLTGYGTFNLYNVVDISGTISINGSGLALSFATPGQDANITFSGTSGQQVSVHITNNTYGGGITVSLLKPDGSTLTSTYNSGTFNLATQTLPTTGTYTINFQHNSYYTGALTVSVTNP